MMNFQTDVDFERVIEQKIREVAVIADQMPAAVVIHQLPDFALRYMSPSALSGLGKQWHEMKGISQQDYHARYFNPEDTQDYVPRIIALLKNNTDEVVSFFQQVRTSKDREWDWYMSSIRILMRDPDNNPVLTINIAMKVDPGNRFTQKAVRLLEENQFIREHFQEFAKLGKRETAVLRLLALGKSAQEIAKELYISVATAETHRKNIRKKLKTTNSYELSKYAHAFNLI
jgi:DNA-binding CsgD family transcriptional regulator